MKKGLVIVLSALVLASCGRPQRTVSPKSSDTKQTSTSEKKQSGMDLKAIKAKDYSSIILYLMVLETIAKPFMLHTYELG